MLCSSLGLPRSLRFGRVGLLISAPEPQNKGFLLKGLGFRVPFRVVWGFRVWGLLGGSWVVIL